jgi:hypothetical protein
MAFVHLGSVCALTFSTAIMPYVPIGHDRDAPLVIGSITWEIREDLRTISLL